MRWRNLTQNQRRAVWVGFVVVWLLLAWWAGWLHEFVAGFEKSWNAPLPAWLER